MPEIVQVSGFDDLEVIKALFCEYQQELDTDLCFQGFRQELNTLPGEYALPNGRLFLIQEKTEAIGCVALKPVGNNQCKMKRLYVRPQFRGQRFGRLLIMKLIDAAREIGYSAMRLETLSHWVSAISLYRQLGFVVTEPTYQQEDLHLVFLELELH